MEIYLRFLRFLAHLHLHALGVGSRNNSNVGNSVAVLGIEVRLGFEDLARELLPRRRNCAILRPPVNLRHPRARSPTYAHEII